MSDMANDECLDILSPSSNVCPFQINKETIGVMSFFATNYNLNYITAARDIVELNEEIRTAPRTAAQATIQDDDASPLANVENTRAVAEPLENLSDDEEKDEMKNQIRLLNQDQIDHLQFFLEFIDSLRKDVKYMSPTDMLHAMIMGCKFHKSLKRKNVSDLKTHYDALSALDNHANEFTQSWEGMVDYPGRKGSKVFEKWLDEVENYISQASSADNLPSPSRKGSKQAKSTTENNVKSSSTSNDILDAVTVTTIHRAKGREWPTVIIARMNEGVFPASSITRKHLSTVNSLVSQNGNSNEYHRQNQIHTRGCEEDLGVIEEERRLAYVAITRASQELILSSIKHNGDEYVDPSRFIEECFKSKNGGKR